MASAENAGRLWNAVGLIGYLPVISAGPVFRREIMMNSRVMSRLQFVFAPRWRLLPLPLSCVFRPAVVYIQNISTLEVYIGDFV